VETSLPEETGLLRYGYAGPGDDNVPWPVSVPRRAPVEASRTEMMRVDGRGAPWDRRGKARRVREVSERCIVRVV
jgi:hypothetical protein